MKNYTLLVVAFLLTLATTARTADSLQRQAPAHTLVLKGKVLPWVVLAAGMNYSLGLEYGFGKRNGIGIMAVYNGWSFSNEVYDSVAGAYRSGPRAKEIMRGAFLYYNRYFSNDLIADSKLFNKLGLAGGIPYIGAFVRYGKYDVHYQAGYETNNLSRDTWQYSGGVVAGLAFRHLDINVGPFYKRSYTSERNIEHVVTTMRSSVRSSLGLRVGVNLTFCLKKNSSHLLAM